ncbi:hypothetical protein N431DRAFT_555665 [Stipitochalara longipes BDJ]|nr:hypothetical protein N431DRAFT_555665 [Stipitochalara longipes BDJ]
MVWDLKDETSIEALGVLGKTHNHIIVYRDGVFTGFYRHTFYPPCECAECKQQYRPNFDQCRKIWTYTAALSDEEARVAVSDLTQKIFADLGYLQEQCTLNGNTILKRWKKKTPDQRKATLLEVDPEMYPHQWCDAYFSRDFLPKARGLLKAAKPDYDVTQGRERRAYRGVCLLPYINQEALLNDPTRFLSLLYYRTQHKPEEWAPYDKFLLDKNWELGSFATAYNANCIVMFGDKYGTLTPWERGAAHNWKIIGFPRGFLILEAQQRLMSFFRGVVESLVIGFVRNDTTAHSNNFTEAFKNGLKKPSKKSTSTEFASVYLNQPLSSPPNFDLQALISIAKTQLDLRGDHLWLLQTEPAYTWRYSSLVVAGDIAANITKHNQRVSTASWLMRDAIWFWTWEWILEEVQKLAQFEDISQNSMTLSARSAQALSAVEELLMYQLKFRADEIAFILPLRSGFRTCWKNEWTQVKQTVGVQRNRREQDSVIPPLFFTDRLDFCLTTMVMDPMAEKHPDGMPRHDHSMFFGILDEHLANSKKEEFSRLDEVLYAMYSDLSAVHQMLSLIRFRRPYAPRRTLKEVKASETGRAWRYINKDFLEQNRWRNVRPDSEGKWEDVRTVVNKERGPEKIDAEQHLAGLLTAFLDSPLPKGSCMKQGWLDSDEAQRAALSRFWDGMRQRHRSTLLRLGFGEEDVTLDLKALSADSSADHVQAIRAQREEIMAEIMKNSPEKAALNQGKGKNKAKAAIQTQWGPDDQSTLDIKLESLKIKTRGTLDQRTESDCTAVDEHSESEAERVTVAVQKRALSVFRSMFPGRDLEDRSKNVEWEQFVIAMGEGEVGFVARQSAGGAGFSFEPKESSKWFGKGKIVFHKPHPETYFDPIQMATNGKRMRKWFGWCEHTFVLKK